MGQSFSSPPQSILSASIISVPASTTVPSSSSSTSTTSPSHIQNPLRRGIHASPPLDQATRTRRQAGLFFGGAAFVVFSTLVTRRSLAKRYKPVATPLSPTTITTSAAPIAGTGAGGTAVKLPVKPGYTTATSATASRAAAVAAGEEAAATATAPELLLENSGPILAVEALTLATLNVVSWAMMLTGAALWYFDIASLEEMRRKVRGGLGVDGSGRTEEEAEMEMEEWVAGVLARKEGRLAGEGGTEGADSGLAPRRNERGAVR